MSEDTGSRQGVVVEDDRYPAARWEWARQAAEQQAHIEYLARGVPDWVIEIYGHPDTWWD